MTTYGTNPTSSNNLAPKLEYISRAKNHIRSGLATRRPWKLMLSLRSLSFPRSFTAAAARIRTNAVYFQTNYAIVILFVVFLSLLWHPISLIVLLAILGAWLFLYFLRDEPLTVFDRVVDDRVVLIVMSVITIAILLLTDAAVNIVVAVVVGVAAVVAHAAVRKTEDLYLNDEEASRLVSESSSH